MTPSAPTSPPVGGEVIYHLLTDRFSGDGAVLTPLTSADLGRHAGGNWRGVTARIQDGYFHDLGITHLWVSPVVENVAGELRAPWGMTSSYHGYWTRDFARHNSDFGSRNDLDRLISVATDAGIGLIGDFAPNHTSPSDGDNAAFLDDGALYDDGRFVASRHSDPDGVFHHFGDFCTLSREEALFRNLFNLNSLNHHHPSVDRLLKERIGQWLNAGLTGLRLDAARHMTPGWIRSLMSVLRSRLAFAEWFLDDVEEDLDYTRFLEVTRCAGLDFHVAVGLRRALRERQGWPEFVRLLERSDRCHPQPYRAVTFLDNHDVDRFLTGGDDVSLLHLALVALFTTRGRPVVYYGTEQYLSGAGTDGNPATRAVMPSFSRDTDAYRLIGTLARLRARLPVLRFGRTEQVHVDRDLLITRRVHGTEAVVVAINRGPTSRTVRLPAALAAVGTVADELAGAVGGPPLRLDERGSGSAELPAGAAAVWYLPGTPGSPSVALVEPQFTSPGDDIVLGGLGLDDKQLSVTVGGLPTQAVPRSPEELTVRLPAGLRSGDVTVRLATVDGPVHTVRAAFCHTDGPLAPVRIVLQDAPEWSGVVHLDVLDGTEPSVHGPMYDTFVHPAPSRYYDVALPVGRPVYYRFVALPRGGGPAVTSAQATLQVPDARPTTVTVGWTETR